MALGHHDGSLGSIERRRVVLGGCGNEIQVSGLCPRNLHAVWDVCIIDRRIGADERAAAALRAEITGDDRKAWIPSDIDPAAVASWADESLAIALRPSSFGSILHSKRGCLLVFERRHDLSIKTRSVVIDDAYLDLHSPLFAIA